MEAQLRFKSPTGIARRVLGKWERAFLCLWQENNWCSLVQAATTEGMHASGCMCAGTNGESKGLAPVGIYRDCMRLCQRPLPPLKDLRSESTRLLREMPPCTPFPDSAPDTGPSSPGVGPGALPCLSGPAKAGTPYTASSLCSSRPHPGCVRCVWVCGWGWGGAVLTSKALCEACTRLRPCKDSPSNATVCRAPAQPCGPSPTLRASALLASGWASPAPAAAASAEDEASSTVDGMPEPCHCCRGSGASCGSCAANGDSRPDSGDAAAGGPPPKGEGGGGTALLTTCRTAGCASNGLGGAGAALLTGWPAADSTAASPAAPPGPIGAAAALLAAAPVAIAPPKGAGGGRVVLLAG